MTTVMHGIKDGIDEILEKTNAIDHVLKVRLNDARQDPDDESGSEEIELAIEQVVLLKAQASVVRAAIETVRRTTKKRAARGR